MKDFPVPRPALTPEDLQADGLIADAKALAPVVQDFRMRLTGPMRDASLRSAAVARQFVPSLDELVPHPDDSADPIGDEVHAPVPGLTHRYPDRVILHVTKTCEVYCRFCFRRETVGDTGHLPPDQLEAALDYIARTPAVWEVILTGGDPLVLSPRRIADLLTRLAAIPHVGVVRLHSRVPVVAPARITPDLIAALRRHPAVWLVLHVNHAEELGPEARTALAALVEAGVPVLSQSVLLRGVNDTAEALEDLFRALIRLRVKPYYLHHCDQARGAGHFRTTIAEGQALMQALRGRLSGTCLPTYVLDIPGGYGKVPIGPDYLQQVGDDWRVTDPQGAVHPYRDPDRSSDPT